MPSGGKREGAGPPTLPPEKKRIKSSITLRPEHKAWLDAQPEKTAELVDQAFDLLIASRATR